VLRARAYFCKGFFSHDDTHITCYLCVLSDFCIHMLLRALDICFVSLGVLYSISVTKETKKNIDDDSLQFWREERFFSVYSRQQMVPGVVRSMQFLTQVKSLYTGITSTISSFSSLSVALMPRVRAEAMTRSQNSRIIDGVKPC
jgi:hypothetical protein